jgi:hypothetical protein
MGFLTRTTQKRTKAAEPAVAPSSKEATMGAQDPKTPEEGVSESVVTEQSDQTPQLEAIVEPTVTDVSAPTGVAAREQQIMDVTTPRHLLIDGIHVVIKDDSILIGRFGIPAEQAGSIPGMTERSNSAAFELKGASKTVYIMIAESATEKGD